MNLKFVLNNIAKNLKDLRVENKLTQLEISHHLNMERRGYQKVEYAETGDIKLSTILKILEYYDITLEELMK